MSFPKSGEAPCTRLQLPGPSRRGTPRSTPSAAAQALSSIPAATTFPNFICPSTRHVLFYKGQGHFSSCLIPRWLLTCTQIAKSCTQHLLGKKGASARGNKKNYVQTTQHKIYIHTHSILKSLKTLYTPQGPSTALMHRKSVYIHTAS